MAMSIGAASPALSASARMHKARSVLARSLGVAAAATPVPVLGGAVGTLPALSGLLLFTGLLIAVEHGLAAHHPHPRIGIANRITLVRAGITCLIAARTLDPDPFGAPDRWLLAAMGGAALILDGADGWAARRQQLASVFGARFDMEVDALSILILAITVIKAAVVPGWVLAIGVMRYLYLGLQRVFPALRKPVPPCPFADRRRKTIAVVQSVALLIALVPATPPSWAAAICAVALTLLAYSFAADMVMLLSGRPHNRVGVSLRMRFGSRNDQRRQGEEGARDHDGCKRKTSG